MTSLKGKTDYKLFTESSCRKMTQMVYNKVEMSGIFSSVPHHSRHHGAVLHSQRAARIMRNNFTSSYFLEVLKRDKRDPLFS